MKQFQFNPKQMWAVHISYNSYSPDEFLDYNCTQLYTMRAPTIGRVPFNMTYTIKTNDFHTAKSLENRYQEPDPYFNW